MASSWEKPPLFMMETEATPNLFINQWDLYWGVNNNNTLMMNPYQRAMLFLTYIKGTNVNEYVVAVNQWLSHQLQGRILNTDERLWNEVTASFSQRFANTMEKENTQAILQEGIKMKGEDINEYLAKFEELVRLVGY